MKKTIIIVMIAILVMVAIMLGVFIMIIPDPVPQEPVDIHTDNSLIATLGISRPNTRIERLMAIRTYQGINNMDELIADMIKIGEVGNLEYWEVDPRGGDYLLVVPFEINGKLTVSSLQFNTYEEAYVHQSTIFKANKGANLPDNYSLLIRYSRPTIPEYQLNLYQNEGEQTATYQIINMENGKPVKTTQLVKDDADPGTESNGVEIRIISDKAA